MHNITLCFLAIISFFSLSTSAEASQNTVFVDVHFGTLIKKNKDQIVDSGAFLGLTGIKLERKIDLTKEVTSLENESTKLKHLWSKSLQQKITQEIPFLKKESQNERPNISALETSLKEITKSYDELMEKMNGLSAEEKSKEEIILLESSLTIIAWKKNKISDFIDRAQNPGMDIKRMFGQDFIDAIDDVLLGEYNKEIYSYRLLENLYQFSFIKKARAAFKDKKKNTDVRFYLDSSTEKMITSLRSSDVIGVIYATHPKVHTEEREIERINPETNELETVKENFIVNAFMPETSGRHMPRSLLSAAHSNLQFMLWIYCHEDAVGDFYVKPYLHRLAPYDRKEGKVDASKITFYRPHGINPDTSHALLQKAGYLEAAKTVEEEISPNFKTHLENFETYKKDDDQSFVELKISYRDLKTAVMSYEVLLDDIIVGSFYRAVSRRGTPRNKGDASILVPRSIYMNAKNLIIHHDDLSSRRQESPKDQIDDILIDRIEVLDQEVSTILLETTVHLGNNDYPTDPLVLKKVKELGGVYWDLDYAGFNFGANVQDFNLLRHPIIELKLPLRN